MSESISDKFRQASTEKSFDLAHREIIQKNIEQYNDAFEKGIAGFADLDNAKRKAKLIKWKAIENLEKYLLDFESNFQKRGGKVIWANDAEEARQEILKIVKEKQAKSLIKSKSMVSEEIELNAFLENQQLEVLESDLGEYIVQLLGQKPYHIVTPAMHLSLAEIARLFHEKFGTDLQASPEELTAQAREVLRQQYTKADIGITGANFLIADSGSIAISENEGNARLVSTFPKVHIAIAGIEKVIPSLEDLSLFWPLLASHGTGQSLTTYNSILSAPRKSTEYDGPEEMYVILLDNGRSKLLEKQEQREGLYCIRCGACLNVCPVYQNIGGHSYNSTYSGPIGSLITPHMQGMEAFNHLSQASTLCGKCSEVCPVNIDIADMLLKNRVDAQQQNLVSKSERRGWSLFSWIMGKRKWLDFFNGGIKNSLMRRLFKRSWGSKRELPELPKKSFSSQYKQGRRE